MTSARTAQPSKASDKIWSLLSGVPARYRRGRWLVVLQVYIDDSGVGQPPASVMGGFVASAERWAGFSDDWQDALDMRPAISYFKMSEAGSCSGEFAHWSDSRRDERVALLFSIIEKHALLCVTSAMEHRAYEAVFRGRLDKEFRYLEHPYFLLFYGIVTSVAQYFESHGHSEPIDFIFDSQPDQMKRILDGWQIFQLVADEKIRPLVVNPPIFRNDKTTLPLQAADLHAWWVRRMCDAYLLGKKELKPPFPGKKESLDVRTLEHFWTLDALERMHASLNPLRKNFYDLLTVSEAEQS